MSSLASSLVRFTLPFLPLVAAVGCGGSSGGGGGGGPSVAFVATPTRGTPPLTVQFTDRTSGGPTAWLWEFGDGATSTEQNPSHEYLTQAAYSVKLTVTWADGNQAAMVSANMIQVETVVPPACDMSGAWLVASRFVPDESCDLDLGTELEDFLLQLTYCEPCEEEFGEGGDAYLGSTSLTEGSMGGLLMEVPVPDFPQFAISGNYYESSVDLTFDTSVGLFDSGSTDCESFQCLVSCKIYEGNALVPDGDGGYDIDPEAFLICEGQMEFQGTRVGLFATGQEIHRGAWRASDGASHPVALVIDHGEIQLTVSLGQGGGSKAVQVTGRMEADRSFALELPGETGSMSLSASGWIDEHGVGTGFLQMIPPGAGPALLGALQFPGGSEPR